MDSVGPEVKVRMQLFIFIIFSHVIMVMAINGCRSDRDKDHRLRENCTQAGFNDIPAGLTHSTKVKSSEFVICSLEELM